MKNQANTVVLETIARIVPHLHCCTLDISHSETGRYTVFFHIDGECVSLSIYSTLNYFGNVFYDTPQAACHAFEEFALERISRQMSQQSLPLN